MTTNLSKLLCYKLFNLVKLNEQLIDREMEPLHLSRTEWKVMARFNFLPIPCTQQEVLTSMNIDRAHLTRTLERLEEQGLITKERVPDDKRAFHVSPTMTGVKLLRKIEHVLKSESDSLVKGFTQNEASTLEKLIEKIEKNILLVLEK